MSEIKIPKAKLPKKFLAFLAISAIIGSAIYIYDALNVAKAYTFFAPIGAFTDYIGEKIAEPAKKAIISKGENIKNKLKQASADLINTNVEKIKNEAFSSVKSGVNGGLDALGKIIGIDEQTIKQEQKNNCNCNL